MQFNSDKMCLQGESPQIPGLYDYKEGVKANLYKCRAIIDISSPSTVKEVQSLARKVSALSRFMTKAVDKVAHFFKCKKKLDSFEWIEACEKACLQI